MITMWGPKSLCYWLHRKQEINFCTISCIYVFLSTWGGLKICVAIHMTSVNCASFTPTCKEIWITALARDRDIRLRQRGCRNQGNKCIEAILHIHKETSGNGLENLLALFCILRWYLNKLSHGKRWEKWVYTLSKPSHLESPRKENAGVLLPPVFSLFQGAQTTCKIHD